MANLRERVFTDLATRNDARERFETRLSSIRHDLEKKGVAERVVEKIAQDARDTFEEAKDMASDNKGIIAGTIAALAIWILRTPIMAALEKLCGMTSELEGTDNDGD